MGEFPRETIVNFFEDEELADIFTYSHKWQNHIEQNLGVKPYSDNGEGAKSYKVPKEYIKLPAAKHTKELTEEQRQIIGARLEKIRAKLKVGKTGE